MLRTAMLFRATAAKKPSSAVKAAKASALSAISGNTFPPKVCAQFAAAKFQSPLWLTANQLPRFGVELKADQKEKGTNIEIGGKTVTFFNADQTTDAAKVTARQGKAQFVDALTKATLPRSVEAAIQSANKHETAEWISEKDINALGLTLKPGAEPVVAKFAFADKTVEKKYFPLAQIEDAGNVRRAADVYPTMVTTGRRFHPQVAYVLMRAAMEAKFTSPYWLTLNAAQTIGVVVKDGAAGVDISIGDKVLTFFNAEQTGDAARVAAKAYTNKYAPRSAVSGKMYPSAAAAELRNAQVKNKFSSVFWLSRGQAQTLGIEIMAGAEPVMLTGVDKSVPVYNVSQTNGMDKIVRSNFYNNQA